MNEPILYVDDEPSILSAVTRTMRKDFRIAVAASGREGLEQIQRAARLPWSSAT